MSGEFDFIKSILAQTPQHYDLLVPNGDDAAVVKCGDTLMAISVDTVLEGTHFLRRYSTPRQIGIKALETSISDIVAVGASPEFVLISITLPSNSPCELGGEIYSGIYEACHRTGVIIIGGDTSVGGNLISLSVTAIGRKPYPFSALTRGGAKPGDLIFVTGPLGDSAGGLFALLNDLPGHTYLKTKHLEPACRNDLVRILNTKASAAIDISDGLSSELAHICLTSGVGCIIKEESIPVSAELQVLADHCGKSPYEWAWNGGEDYEILYTVAPSKAIDAPGTPIGTITTEMSLVVERAGKIGTFSPLGFDHFRDKIS